MHIFFSPLTQLWMDMWIIVTRRISLVVTREYQSEGFSPETVPPSPALPCLLCLLQPGAACSPGSSGSEAGAAGTADKVGQEMVLRELKHMQL